MLKYAAENWTSTERLAEFPIQLLDEFENWSLFKKMVQKYLSKQVALEKIQLEKDDMLNLNSYPMDPNLPHYVKYADPLWWKSIPVEFRLEFKNIILPLKTNSKFYRIM